MPYAFYGGVVAALYHHGGMLRGGEREADQKALQQLGEVANAFSFAARVNLGGVLPQLVRGRFHR